MNPLGAIYGGVTLLRNHLYDRRLLVARRLARPVISVGNISAGGSGKTPFVILLGELFAKQGIQFDVLSRGYGRATRGVLVVDPAGSARDFGDEPLLIATSLKCPVIVGASRYDAGVLAESKFDTAFHILDDGFQHRSLARDFDIVLLTSDDLRDQLLPAGRLREPLSSLRRADAIVASDGFESVRLPFDKPIWRLRRSLVIPENLWIKKPIAFCGIARPERFIAQLRAAGIRPVAEKFYRDHHRYTARDIDHLLAMKNRYAADGFVTTEKDKMNLGPLYSRLAPIVFPPLQLELVGPADALDTMLRVIAERSGRA